MGAGVIPFSVCDKDVYFLFQRTFTGRKVGYLIDFGGGLGADENYQEAAIREFVEETGTMYFSDNLHAQLKALKRKYLLLQRCLIRRSQIPLITAVSVHGKMTRSGDLKNGLN